MLATGVAKPRGAAQLVQSTLLHQDGQTRTLAPALSPPGLFLSLRQANLKRGTTAPVYRKRLLWSREQVLASFRLDHSSPSATSNPTSHSLHPSSTDINKMLAPIFLAALAGTAAAIPTPQVEGDGITYGNWTVRADWSRKCTMSLYAATCLLTNST